MIFFIQKPISMFQYLVQATLCFALLFGSSLWAQGYGIGDEVKPFALKNVDGKTWKLKKLKKSKGAIVVFTCNHCPYSVAYEERLIALDKKYKKLGYPVIAINPNDPAVAPDDSYEKMKERATEKEFSFPYLFDAKQEVYPQFGATKTPHCYILQKDEVGKMRVAYIGAVDDSKDTEDVEQHYLSDALDALLAGKKPEPATTKAFGCSIKTAKK